MHLIFNAGSTSLKYALFDETGEISHGEVEQVAVGKVLAEIGMKPEDINVTGHRVVFAGAKYRKPMQITSELIVAMRQNQEIAPLHNPPAWRVIEAAQAQFTNAKHYAVFDAGFYETLSDTVISYALPQDLVKKYGLRRYGYHGLSHEYASKKACEELKLDYAKTKIISCHLGGGSSVTAIRDGIAVDTSMGFSPFSGLPMMTRSGDIDPFIPLYLLKKEGYSVDQMEMILGKKSSLAAIAGTDANMRSILEAETSGDASAHKAVEMFVYAIKKCVGSFYAVMGGCDLLVFTGAIGARSKRIRNEVIAGLPFSPKTYFTETDEEKMMWRKITNV